MKELFFGHVLIAALILFLPCFAGAEEEKSVTSSQEEGDKGAAPQKGTDEAAKKEGEGSATTEADLLSILGTSGGETSAGTEGGDKATKGLLEETKQEHPIWAVQRIYALKQGRLDLQPAFGVSMNDPYVQHMALNLAASYYLTEVLAIGLSANYYWGNFETDLNYSLSRATHQAVPLNEYLWGAQLNFTYVPMYGKFAMFKQWILHWDVWVIGGGGMISTRPIPNIDPDYRTFDWKLKVSFNVGIGGRVFLNRFLAIYVEVRDYIFPEILESLEASQDPEVRIDSDTWLEDGVKLTNNVMLQAGVSVFLPFTFEYELPN